VGSDQIAREGGQGKTSGRGSDHRHLESRSSRSTLQACYKQAGIKKKQGYSRTRRSNSKPGEGGGHHRRGDGPGGEAREHRQGVPGLRAAGGRIRRAPAAHPAEVFRRGRGDRSLKSGEIVDALNHKIDLALRYMDDKTMSEASFRDLALGTAAMIEKRQLLRGEPTAIISDAERAKLHELLPLAIAEAQRRGLTIEGQVTEKTLNLLDVPRASPPRLVERGPGGVPSHRRQVTEQDRKENQIKFYKPVSPKSQPSTTRSGRVVAAGGGNGSAKTETMLVEVVMCATGIFPDSQRHLIEQKFRGPINCRVTVESLTTTLEPIILPKLQWFRWTGVDRPGGEKGHWGWIPKSCLIDGEWDRSYSNKLRILRVLCRDPHNPDKVLGESTIQFMSLDQDSTDFASGDFHICAHDEPPSLPIWRENEARTMRVDGRMLLAMTWPDDPSIGVDWIYDEVYEPGRSGNDPKITWIELWTTENPHLEAGSRRRPGGEVVDRDHERPHLRAPDQVLEPDPPGFHRQHEDLVLSPAGKRSSRCPANEAACGICGSEKIVDYNHVEEFDHSARLADRFPDRPASAEAAHDAVGADRPARRLVDRRRRKNRGRLRRNEEPKRPKSSSEQPRSSRAGSWTRTWAQVPPGSGAKSAGRTNSAAGLACELGDDSGVGRQPHQPRSSSPIRTRCARGLGFTRAARTRSTRSTATSGTNSRRTSIATRSRRRRTGTTTTRRC
jgi:hypothetical protein